MNPLLPQLNTLPPAGDAPQTATESSTLPAPASSACAAYFDLDGEGTACPLAETFAVSGVENQRNARNVDALGHAPADATAKPEAGSDVPPDSDPSSVLRPPSSIPPAPAPVAYQTQNTDRAWQEAEAQAGVCRAFAQLLQDPQHSLRTAAAALGKPASFFSGANSVYARWQRHGLAGLLPAQRESAARTMDVPAWFIPAARFFYLLSNRTANSGSVPEAVRRTISLPELPFGWTTTHRDRLVKAISAAIPSPAGAGEGGQSPDEGRGGKTNPCGATTDTGVPICPPELREQILARQAAGQPLVTERIARQILVNPSIVQQFRSPRDWSLANQSAPGSQRRATDTLGERHAMAPGDWFGGDDATPGIAVCVPVNPNEVCTPTTLKFGVLLGRFQWLAYHDARADKILASDYVVRPRGSYRAEDILNGMGAVVRTHGIPRRGFQFEGGSWNSKLVQHAIKLLGCEHWRTYSPHQKAIESVFNRVWTRLAVQFPHADMGRYQSENEANCHLYEDCKAAHKDPRRYFPTLAIVTQVFEAEVAAHNARQIFSEQYGRWVPDDFFAHSVQASALRTFSREMEWIFSPYAAERTVRGMLVRCRVPMFEQFSVPFEFGADFLPLYHGKKVRIHFNPRQPKCLAKVILLETAGHKKAGDILGDAQLIGETAGHIRYVMECGDDNQRAGYLQRQKVGTYMRRETRAIGIGGRVEYAKSEERGLSTQIAITKNAASVSPSPAGAGEGRGEGQPGETIPAFAGGTLQAGSGDPDLLGAAPQRGQVPQAGIHCENPVRSESPHTGAAAADTGATRAARRAELEVLRRETENLFV